MALLKLCIGIGLLLRVDAFGLYDAKQLYSKYGTPDACAKALSADIACHQRVSSFLNTNRRGPLEDVALTDAVCSNTCSESLREWFETVSQSCKGESFPTIRGKVLPPQHGGYLWAGWNETCLRDEETNRYCSDILDEFPKFESRYEIPHEQLCHPCYGRLLAMMQASQYSKYSFVYKQHLEHVYETCGGSGPTDVLPRPTEGEEPTEPFCLTDKYHVTKEGDTCDSISKDAGVSGAYLYFGNRELIHDCLDIPAGLKLCLPTPCKTYYVMPGETCFAIAQSLGIKWDTIEYYNSWVGRDCKNLQTATDFYGKSVCMGPVGTAESIANAQKSSNTHRKISSGNGPVYYWRMPPPEGVEPAKGTTVNCAQWHVVDESDTCLSISREYQMKNHKLLWYMNPSVRRCKRNDSLIPGTALCVIPNSQWSKDEYKEDEYKEDDAKEDDAKEDDAKEDDAKEDDAKEDKLREDDSREDLRK